VKTLIVASPQVTHAYRMCRPGQSPHSDSVCFEVLGFDIMLDKKMKPWLLEVNRAPSFGGDERIDREIKSGVIRDALVLVNIRASDKRRNLASQKAETRRRLMRPFNHHIDNGEKNDETSKRKFIINRRKQQLKERLLWIRKDAAREEYEDSHLGNYMRIFPCLDATQRDRYTALLTEAFKLFHFIRSAPFQKNIIEHYNPKREDEILHLIEQCEEEDGSKPYVKDKKSLSSMPTLPTPPPSNLKCASSDSCSSTERSDDYSSQEERNSSELSEGKKASWFGNPKVNLLPPSLNSKTKLLGSGQSRRVMSATASISSKSRPPSGKKSNNSSRRTSRNSLRDVNDGYGLGDSPVGPRGGGSQNSTNGKLSHQISSNSDSRLISGFKERETENIQRTLMALDRTRIKFPGKTDEEADVLIDNIMENWREHKPKIAHYWLVQLDTAKRKKVIEIVQGNVKAVVERVWRWSNVNTLKLNRLFNRVFNRMQWSRGQGLWNCFVNIDCDSWETIFSKSSEVIGKIELNCCRRIVQLCKNCLLIVYQFANEAKKATALSSTTGAVQSTSYISRLTKDEISATTAAAGSTSRPFVVKPRNQTSSFSNLPRKFTKNLEETRRGGDKFHYSLVNS